MEKGTSYNSVSSRDNQITSYKSLTFLPSLWHRGLYPNRFSMASSEVSRDSRDS